MRVTAECCRVDDYWAVEVREVPGVFTLAPNLDQVPAMVRNAVCQATGVPESDIEVDVQQALRRPDGKVGS